MSLRVGKRFKLGKLLGNGSFGEIYEGQEIATGQPVAVKLERLGVEFPQLVHEARIYNTLQHLSTIPRLHFFGQEGGYNVLVVEKLGANMESIMHTYPHHRLPLAVVLAIAQGALTALEGFHAAGFVHRDLKPENLLVDCAGHNVFLVDFGLSKMVRDPTTGDHIPARSDKRLIGTPRYASIPNHLGKEQGRRDDLESLGYVLVYLLQGELPWQHKKEEGHSRYAAILAAKQAAQRDGSLCSALPPAFRRYFRYVTSLRFEETPDYARCRRLFEVERETRRLPHPHSLGPRQ